MKFGTNYGRILLGFTVIIVLAISGCSSTSTLPDVVGYQLDDAHNALKDANFKKFEDSDALENRRPWIDANWVVLEQSPGGGEEVKESETIKLGVAKKSDEGVISRIPPGSPVGKKLHERKSENEKKERDREKSNLKEREEFVDEIDPQARLIQNLIETLSDAKREIQSAGDVSRKSSSALQSAVKVFSEFKSTLGDAPSAVKSEVEELEASIDSFSRAADTLKTAFGSAAAGSLARFDQIYDEAVSKYNSELRKLYDGTSVDPPIV